MRWQCRPYDLHADGIRLASVRMHGKAAPIEPPEIVDAGTAQDARRLPAIHWIWI